MNTFQIDLRALRAQNLTFGEDDLIVELADGRTISVPLAWFPRLFHAAPRRARQLALDRHRHPLAGIG